MRVGNIEKYHPSSKPALLPFGFYVKKVKESQTLVTAEEVEKPVRSKFSVGPHIKGSQQSLCEKRRNTLKQNLSGPLDCIDPIQAECY